MYVDRRLVAEVPREPDEPEPVEVRRRRFSDHGKWITFWVWNAFPIYRFYGYNGPPNARRDRSLGVVHDPP